MTGDSCPTELLPAYALGALDAEEQAIVSQHLLDCDACLAEIRAFEEVVEVLPFAAQQHELSSDLKQNLMTAVGGDTVVPNQSPAKPSLGSRLADWLRPRPLLVGAAIIAIVILAAGNFFLWRQASSTQMLTEFQLVALAGSRPGSDAFGLVVFDAHGHEGTVIVDGLRPLEPSEQYQLWLIKDGERQNGGVFDVTESGYGWLAVHSEVPLQSFSSFGITIEPFGGSPGPTGAKVMGSN
ncbi:MAG: anti-sigma factor [Caldilineales bacterium]|nr:anti-sigma factor [Caldilineales bacterium]